MTPMEFAEKIIAMPAEMQNEFFEKLKTELSEEDVQTVMKFTSLLSMFLSPAKHEAMKEAVHDALCEEFFGHIVEPQKNIVEDDYNLIYSYSNSIL